MKPVPRVTALIDTYNHERFIAEAIESVLAQDFPASEMEILVVDDGSTDHTPEIIRGYGDRVRYIRKENGGQASALNVGFSQARGEIIALLDSDDVWLPQKIHSVMEAFQQHPEVGTVFHASQYWRPDQALCVADPSFVPLSGNLSDQDDAILRLGGISTSWTTIRREVARRILPLPQRLRLFADSYLMSAAIFCAPVTCINMPLARYRHHSANLTFSTDPDPVRAKRSNDSFRCAIEELRSWLDRNGFLARSRAAALLLERMALVEQLQRFVIQTPGRAEYLAYLRRYHRLYAPIWSRSYRFFDRVKAVAGFVLGYEGFFAAQQFYRRSRSLPRLRESFLPALRRELSPAAAAVPPESLELR